MPATPLAGDRARRARHPGDITGARYAQLLAEQEAKRAAASIDISEVRKDARSEGFSQGWDAAIAWVIETYGLDTDDIPEPGE
jgi:hypothetical protein